MKKKCQGLTVVGVVNGFDDCPASHVVVDHHDIV
jgi:hypothetical protein